MKQSLLLFAYSFVAFCVVEGTGWNVLKPEHPVEEKTTPNEKPTTEPSMATDLLEIFEFVLDALIEQVKDWKMQQAKCEDLQQEMDKAMDLYKVSHKQNDAVEVLKLVDAILDLQPTCFGGESDSAAMNAIYIARDMAGLPVHDDVPDDKVHVHDPNSKGSQFGRMIGTFVRKHFGEPNLDLSDYL